MLIIKIIHTLIGLLMVAIIIAGSAFAGVYFTDMTFVQFLEKMFSLDLNVWWNLEFQRFGFFFILGMLVFGFGLFPIKLKINEFFELRFYQFN